MDMWFLVLGGSHFEMRIVGFNLGFLKSDFSILKNDYKFCNQIQGGNQNKERKNRKKNKLFQVINMFFLFLIPLISKAHNFLISCSFKTI